MSVGFLIYEKARTGRQENGRQMNRTKLGAPTGSRQTNLLILQDCARKPIRFVLIIFHIYINK